MNMLKMRKKRSYSDVVNSTHVNTINLRDTYLELFLSDIERELFEIPKKRLGYSNFSTEEWECMQSSANDKSIVIKKADKGSCVVVWDRDDYIADAEKQLKDKNLYRDVDFKRKIL